MRRLIVISIVGLAGAAGLLAGRWALAQGMVVGGNALDANPMYGSGGNNARTARRAPVQNDIYTVQDGRMQHNESNAFAQPRYVPVGREGQAQASAMTYSNQAPRNPNLATKSGYGGGDAGGGGTYRDYTTKAPANAFQTPAYTPTRTTSSVDPSINYRIPSQGGAPTAQRTYPAAPPASSAGEALDTSAAAGRAADGGRGVKDEKYRVPGVRYGQ